MERRGEGSRDSLRVVGGGPRPPGPSRCFPSPAPFPDGQVKREQPGPCQRAQAGTKTPLKSRSNAQRFMWAWEEAAGFGPHSIMGCGGETDEAGASVGPLQSPRSPGSPPVRRRRPQGRVSCLDWPTLTMYLLRQSHPWPRGHQTEAAAASGCRGKARGSSQSGRKVLGQQLGHHQGCG